DLTDAKLGGADLTSADLTDAKLGGADLTSADLTDAKLGGADLGGANLKDAVGLRLPAGAIWNRETRWPTNLATTVVEQSEELAPGVYRVRGEETPDRSGSVRV
ncbi:pentapeptide repeat-containing protein, partial [Streptomyces antnestii]